MALKHSNPPRSFLEIRVVLFHAFAAFVIVSGYAGGAHELASRGGRGEQLVCGRHA